MISLDKRHASTLSAHRQSAIHRNFAADYVLDLANVITTLSETGAAKLLGLHLAGDHKGIGVFLDSEVHHYRANRGD
jgi:hypothetical protein